MATITFLTNLNRTGVPGWLWIICGLVLLVLLAFPLVGAWRRHQFRKRINAIAPQSAAADDTPGAEEILGTTAVLADQEPAFIFDGEKERKEAEKWIQLFGWRQLSCC